MSSNNIEELLQEIKDSALICHDTLQVMNEAIMASTMNPSYLLAPIEIIQKELLQVIVQKIDDALNL